MNPKHHVIQPARAKAWAAWVTASLVLSLSGCGGGGGDGDPAPSEVAAGVGVSSPAPSPQTTSIGGTTTAGTPASSPSTTPTPPADPSSTPAPAPAPAPAPTPSPAADPMIKALAEGNAAGVDLAKVMSATRTLLVDQLATRASVRQTLFGLSPTGGVQAGSVTSIDWNPSHDSVYFEVLDQGRNQTLLSSNWRYKGATTGRDLPLAVVGVDPQTSSRYAAFGGNPLAVRGNAAMDTVMKNTVAWLTRRTDLTGLKVVTAHLPSTATTWFKHEVPTRQWLTAQAPGIAINGVAGANAVDDSCDGAALNACLQSADLLVLGRQEAPNSGASSYDGPTVMNAVKAAQARGVAVLYLHHDGDTADLSARMLDHLGLSTKDNYFGTEGLLAADTSTQAKDTSLAQTLSLLDRMAQNNFSTTFGACVTQTGKTSCDADTALQDEFITTMEALRKALRAMDAEGLALYDQPGYALEKHLVLLGDKYREAVTYPMDKMANREAFFRAQFSDMTAYINRRVNAVAANQGSFAPAIPNTTPAVQRVVNTHAPETGQREHLTGLYVMPGRTVTLTRTDNAAANITLGINMLRDTTRVFNTNGYDRPMMLSSPRVPLLKDKAVTITSPYGGPLILFVSAVAGAPAVSVQVDGVTTHPVLRNLRDPAEVAAFKAELATTPTNWVGLTTEFLTVHSTKKHINTTLAAHSGDMNLLADRLMTYMIKDTYELAGFNAPGGVFSLPSNVSAFCTDAGWDCTGVQHRRDAMQHVIADTVAACGAGCSGNPYDQNWALEPLGWGETHEIGHNLQRGRLNIYAGQSGEVSNNIFPVHKQMAFNRATNPTSAIVARANSTSAVFAVLKESLQPGASATLAYDRIWSDTGYAANNSERVNFYRQLVEFARHYNTSFSDGWELMTLTYLMERNFTASSANWATVKDAMGFGTYTTHPSTINGNDFLLIATSRIIGRDMRLVFAMWGVTTSAQAQAQVAAFGYAAAETLLFPMANLNAHGSGVGAPVLMNATAVYPAGY
jgi:immunomodulating metalloprotease